jgi:hypothetical protein
MKKVVVKVIGLVFALVAGVVAMQLGCPEAMAKGFGMVLAAMAVIAE